jgi:beta-lactamase superfamily II metal-dependent hydrolase
MVSVEIFPAINGDCFLITSEECNILIDGGYSQTATDHLIPRLKELKLLGKHLDLLVVTHIDSDHISGVITLLEQNEQNSIIEIRQVWHNSLKHVSTLDKGNQNLTTNEKRLIADITNPINKVDGAEQARNISYKQGSTLAAIVARDGYDWNASFQQKAVSIEHAKKIELKNKVFIYLLSPSNQKLKDLNERWRLKLFQLGIARDRILNNEPFDDAFEMLLKNEKLARPYGYPRNISAGGFDLNSLLISEWYEDDSPTNGSSIAFVLNLEGKYLLFLGDAHPSLLLQSIEDVKSEVGEVAFDLIKVAHHGAFPNNSVGLLKALNGINYVFSTNGSKHGHPNKETIAHLINHFNHSRSFYFNYPPAFQADLIRVIKQSEKNIECHFSEAGFMRINL